MTASTGPKEAENATCGAGLIAMERGRQVAVEGYSVEHDREHGSSNLSAAGYFYETHGYASVWPFTDRPKVKGALRNLVRAGALYQAASEIAPTFGQWNREHYESSCDRVADRIDALIAEVRAEVFDA